MGLQVGGEAPLITHRGGQTFFLEDGLQAMVATSAEPYAVAVGDGMSWRDDFVGMDEETLLRTAGGSAERGMPVSDFLTGVAGEFRTFLDGQLRILEAEVEKIAQETDPYERWNLLNSLGEKLPGIKQEITERKEVDISERLK